MFCAQLWVLIIKFLIIFPLHLLLVKLEFINFNFYLIQLFIPFLFKLIFLILSFVIILFADFTNSCFHPLLHIFHDLSNHFNCHFTLFDLLFIITVKTFPH